MQDTEQWLSTGNCDLCRRKKYCKKPCKPSERRQQMRITGIVAEIMYDAMMKTKER